MKKIFSMQTVLLACMFSAAGLGASRACAQVDGMIVTKEGREIVGRLVWKGSQRLYSVTIGGVGQVQTTVALDQVRDLRIKNPPAGLEGAVKQVQDGRSINGAIPVLKQIFESYEMLQYDAVAGRWLAEAYVLSKQYKEAVTVCEKLARNNPDALADPVLASAYTNALLAMDQVGRLNDVLKTIIKQGSRESAAVALVRRGDLELKRNKYQDALVDGYLRAVILFEDIRPAQPEALYKAALCFDQLNQGTYAERMRKKLLQSYPQDPLAEKVKSGK